MITTAVGNYPKIGPPAKAPSLRGAITRHDRGNLTESELAQVADQVTTEVIQQQIEAGLDLVTDGQIRWDDGQTYFTRGIKGFSVNGLVRYFDTNTYYRQPVAEAALEPAGGQAARDFRFAQWNSSRPVKPVLTGPYTLAQLSQDRHYGGLRDLALALAAAQNREALALQEAGATIIQFDEPAIARHPEDIALFADVAQVVTNGLSVKTAMYTWFRDVVSLAPDLFQLPYQVYGLDLVAGPANYGILRHLPSDKELGAGIIDARNTRLESEEELLESLQRVAQEVPLDRVYLNPSCGLEYLPRDRAYQKLVRLVSVAQKAREVLA